MSSDDLDQGCARYSLHLQSLGIDVEKLERHARGTVTTPSKPTTLDRLSLPRVSVSALGDSTPGDFRVGKLLGQGGMGKVVLATQRAMERDVALKFLREPDDETRGSELLREGLVTGQLEHPNIVPVHLLARTDDGHPFFVMKRIEGTSWSKLLSDAGALAAFPRRGAKEPLVFHLEVLLEVCDAIAFAHSRGVLHRDLKPDNVMLGAFGEVYVLDWGIALGLGEQTMLPHVKDASGLAGTPAYMAPEMAAAEKGSLSERTDVYLLGSLLCEVLTGKPPHLVGHMVQQLTHAFLGERPTFPASAPVELVTMCQRALARRPQERFGSVAAFRDALSDYLAHRDAYAVQAESLQRLSALEGLVASKADAAKVQQTFSECRFGFQQALKLFAGFAEAEVGLERALSTMTEYELSQGNLGAARALLSQLRRPRPQLQMRLEDAERAVLGQAERVKALETFAKDADLDAAVQQRGALALAVALVWALISLAVGHLVRRGVMTFAHREALFAITAYAAMSLAITETLKRKVTLNRAQHRLLRGNLVALAAFVSFWAMAWWLHVPFAQALVFFMFLVSALWWAAGALFDARGVTMGAAFLVGTLAAALLPAWQIEVFGVTTLCGFSALGLAWRRWTSLRQGPR